MVQPANVRRTPGYAGKPADDVLGYFRPKTVVNVQGDPQQADNLLWWRTGGITATGSAVVGNVAETDVAGQPLLAPISRLCQAPRMPDAGSQTYLAAITSTRVDISQLWGKNPEPASI